MKGITNVTGSQRIGGVLMVSQASRLTWGGEGLELGLQDEMVWDGTGREERIPVKENFGSEVMQLPAPSFRHF